MKGSRFWFDDDVLRFIDQLRVFMIDNPPRELVIRRALAFLKLGLVHTMDGSKVYVGRDLENVKGSLKVVADWS